MISKRPFSFYAKLKDLEALIMPTMEHVGNALEECDCVLVANSTTGMEAILYGKPVFTLEKPYYFVDGPMKTVNSMADLSDLEPPRKRFTAEEKEQYSYDIYRHVLSGVVDGDFHKIDFQRRENMLVLSNSFKEFF